MKLKVNSAKTSQRVRRPRGASPQRHTTAREPYDHAQMLRNWRRQLRFFKGIESKLFADPELRDKHVAIVDEAFVDSDPDKFRLYDRVRARWPGRPTLIVAVDPERRKAIVRSPRLAP